MGLSIDGRLENLADGESKVLALDSTEYLAARGSADNGNGFLLMDDVVETRDEARGLAVSAD